MSIYIHIFIIYIYKHTPTTTPNTPLSFVSTSSKAFFSLLDADWDYDSSLGGIVGLLEGFFACNFRTE